MGNILEIMIESHNGIHLQVESRKVNIFGMSVRIPQQEQDFMLHQVNVHAWGKSQKKRKDTMN